MKIIKTITFLLMCFCLNSCFIAKKAITASKAKNEYTVENYAIPPEFGKNSNEVLIGLLKGPDYYNNFLEKKIKKSYNGDYILVSNNEINSEKYSNLNKFRYLFTYKDGSTTETTYTKSSGREYTTTHTQMKFYVYDRLTKKEYINGVEFPYYAKAMEIYLEQLEKQRIKN